jgi:hypothetical protein
LIDLTLSSEIVEKVQMANSGYFSIAKNQLLSSQRRPQDGQFYGFSTVSPEVVSFKFFLSKQHSQEKWLL